MNATLQQTRSVGILLLTRALLEEYQRAGISLVIRAVGMVIIDPAVTPELANATIDRLDVTGYLLGWDSLLKHRRSKHAGE